MCPKVTAASVSAELYHEYFKHPSSLLWKNYECASGKKKHTQICIKSTIQNILWTHINKKELWNFKLWFIETYLWFKCNDHNYKH